ncbi:MAG: anhydro-N-acetylmuramic acid kinase [Deltaproteobacteria bacterium]|nr:anhydro-N-acetylmuramic acid kinase [Deltaproteobacteria bacterium]
MEKNIVIGLMSGTSMDGVDGLAIRTDGESFVEFIGAANIRYSAEAQLAFKGLEALVRETLGDATSAEKTFADKFYPALLSLSNKDRADVVMDWLSKTLGTVSYQGIVDLSTDYHIAVVKETLVSCLLSAADVCCIGYHGQTLFHRPSARVTVQVGNAQRMADELGIDVVTDFRRNDVEHGGQGAPFAPLYHQLLARQARILPCAFANCGGISNVTVLGKGENDIVAFDAGPGNSLIDALVKGATNGAELCDRDGQYGQKGKVNKRVLEICMEQAVIVEGQNYLKKVGPKSLDVADSRLLPEVLQLSLEDGCRTLEAFTAQALVASIDQLGIEMPTTWVLHGGGWSNPVICKELQERLNQRAGKPATLHTADEVGLRAESLEAEIFAYLAMRSILSLPLSVPGTTGVPQPLTGGVLFKHR